MMKRRDIISGLFWLCIGLGLSVWTLSSYTVGHLTQPGTGYLPLALGIILIVLSLILLIDRLRKHPDAADTAEAPPEGFIGWQRVAYTVAALLVAAVCFEQVGYLLTFFILIVLLMKGVARQSWRQILLTALITTACVYLVFVRLLGVQLPQGFLGV